LPKVLDTDRLEETLEWAHNFYDEMMKTDPSNILPPTYLPLTEQRRLI
jgi:hypothetical protein